MFEIIELNNDLKYQVNFNNTFKFSDNTDLFFSINKKIVFNLNLVINSTYFSFFIYLKASPSFNYFKSKPNEINFLMLLCLKR